MKHSAANRRRYWCARLFGAALALLASLDAVAAPPPLQIAGSTTLAPAIRTATATLKESRGIAYRVRTGGSEEALRELAAGRIDVAMVSRPLRPYEIRDFHAVEVAQDNLAVIVNGRNPADRTSFELLRSIFSQGLANWPDAGGPPGTIVPVVRGSGHATRTFFDEVVGTGNLVPSGVIELNSNAAMVMYVAADPQAIGYASVGAAADAQQRGLSIRTMLVDGLSPDAGDGRYPLSRPLLLVTRHEGMKRKEFGALIEYLRSGAGQALLRSYGFLPRSR